MQTNILDWLEATAAHTPEGTAVGDAQQDYTWAQLAENARRTGSFLAGHTAPRRPVAFYLEKSAPVFAAMLGTVYAGCCYSVLDTRQPAARTQQVLSTITLVSGVSRVVGCCAAHPHRAATIRVKINIDFFIRFLTIYKGKCTARTRRKSEDCPPT